MVKRGMRQGAVRAIHGIIIGLCLGFAGLAIYHYVNLDRSEVDPALQAELERANLPPTPTVAQPGDWPQWRGPNRDGVSQETGLLTSWPADGPPRLWTNPLGEGYSAISVTGGRLYTMCRSGGDEIVVCLDAGSGKDIWRRPYPCDYHSDQGSGPRSTPTVDGDRVYTVGATGIFHCLRASDGEVLWRHDLLDDNGTSNLQWGVSFSPLVVGDRVYGNPGGNDKSFLVAFDKLSGKQLWSIAADPAGYSSPVMCRAAGHDQVLFFTGTSLVSVSPEGQELWHFPWKTSYAVNAATPVCVGDYVFISSGYGSGCALLKVERKDDGTLQAKRVYKNLRMGDYHASNVYYKEHLYGFHDGRLVCMEFRTGKQVWVENGFVKGSLLLADGHLIVLSEDGRLVLVEARPDEYHEKAAFQLPSGKWWTMPVLAHGKLYVRDERWIGCFDVTRY